MEEFLHNIGVGVRPIDDSFFKETYKVCKVFQRKGVTVEDDEELCHETMKEFPCVVSTCTAIFQTLIDFEIHYNSCHRYVCAECKTIRPNPRLLEIHVQEVHDTFFKILSKKQPLYQCFVSECSTLFNNPVERKQHCVSVHKFPKHYRFDNTEQHKNKEDDDKMDIDVDKKSTKTKAAKVYLNNQKTKMFVHKKETPTCSETTSVNLTNLNKEASLKFVPRQVQKSYSKVLTKNQSKEKNVLETETMTDLLESLLN